MNVTQSINTESAGEVAKELNILLSKKKFWCLIALQECGEGCYQLHTEEVLKQNVEAQGGVIHIDTNNLSFVFDSSWYVSMEQHSLCTTYTFVSGEQKVMFVQYHYDFGI